MPEAKIGFMARLAELWREHPLLMATVTLVILLLGAVVVAPIVRAVLAYLQRSGNEPPIRVKGGSIYLQLGALPYTASSGNRWTNDSGWIAEKGLGRGNDHFGVITFPTGAGLNCTSREFLSNHEELTVTFTDTSVSPNQEYPMLFNVKDHGSSGSLVKKTTLDPGRLTFTPRTGDERWLDMTKEGYLSKLEVKKNGAVQKTCTFTKADDAEIVLFEW